MFNRLAILHSVRLFPQYIFIPWVCSQQHLRRTMENVIHATDTAAYKAS